MDNYPHDSGSASENLVNGLPMPDLSEDVLELDHVFQALAESRRRYLVYTLKSKTEWELPEIAAKVASWEMNIPEHEIPDEEIELIYASLYHTHVPKLVDEGVLTFDSKDETIRPGPNAPQVLTALAGAGASLDSRQEDHAREDVNDSS